MVKDLIVFCFTIGCCRANWILKGDCNYFIYQVDCPLLRLLPHPGKGTESLTNDEVGLLPRHGGLYTIAALVPTSDPLLFSLRLFEPENWS
ncbi:hypothetical protein E2562_037642 [Oryza meyeriana var. granulata]|uniref:Uncharacterized protein n=1 Tax=Oryza meyeriana var. granulata TaxID=110450 RepID=A0A6G1CLQ1_9ORYZ|nr:hypothetical protein E2562_037642 [Oryza meyeriana var. granulata]